MEDAHRLAFDLGIRTLVLPIDQIMRAYQATLAEAFAGHENDVTEENVQARIRGNLLMALSNKFGSLLLTTGNKSELAVGYCTLYGDMCGGLAVISDVPKAMVYRLARYRNLQGTVIPPRVLTKAPSAELRLNQTDQDSLPPYDVLDQTRFSADISSGTNRLSKWWRTVSMGPRCRTCCAGYDSPSSSGSKQPRASR